MVIRRSAATEIRHLIAALGEDDEVRREVAIARLRVIGPRAMDHLPGAYDASADRDTRLAILRAMENALDPRAMPIARKALAEGGDLAVVAVSSLRALLESPHPPTAADALDVLIALALERGIARRVRLAALEALRDVPGETRGRIENALRTDTTAGLTERELAGPRDPVDAVWRDALEGRLPDTPATLRDAAATLAPVEALGTVRKLIDAVREREGAIRSPVKRAEWCATRGALHQALAQRGSRIAVYDLRETVAAAREPLPVSFLTALHAVGDESCLEAVAAAHSNGRPEDARWRQQLGSVFRAISRRERITRRHAVMKRVVARYPDAAREFMVTG